jgi:hypothetical protein
LVVFAVGPNIVCGQVQLEPSQQARTQNYLSHRLAAHRFPTHNFELQKHQFPARQFAKHQFRGHSLAEHQFRKHQLQRAFAPNVPNSPATFSAPQRPIRIPGLPFSPPEAPQSELKGDAAEPQ